MSDNNISRKERKELCLFRTQLSYYIISYVNMYTQYLQIRLSMKYEYFNLLIEFLFIKKKVIKETIQSGRKFIYSVFNKAFPKSVNYLSDLQR